jgi:hypothetical protein
MVFFTKMTQFALLDNDCLEFESFDFHSLQIVERF